MNALQHINIDINPTLFLLKEGDDPIFTSESISTYMSFMNESILEHHEWDDYKKYTNPYEYVHNHSIYKPISHSYFKMIEIAQYYKLLSHNIPIKTLHLADGHGFVEAIHHLRTKCSDVHTAITTYDPGWKFLKTDTGVDGIGNIMNPDNLRYFIRFDKMDLITGNGQCDNKFMMTQIFYALLLQKNRVRLY